MYTTLLMSTGLTFGSICALFGLSHDIIHQRQYSLLIVTVILSAVVPTLIANAFYLPRHLLPRGRIPEGPEVPPSLGPMPDNARAERSEGRVRRAVAYGW